MTVTYASRQLDPRRLPLSIYSSGADAFRDTTKWLVAFVPIATVVAAGAVIGPRLVDEATTSASLLEWARSNVLPLVGIAIAVGGVVLVVSFGARVLSTQPSDFTTLFTTDQAKLSSAFSAGVGAPYFLEDRAFRSAVAELDAKWSADEDVTDPELARTVAAADMLREWALHDALATSFKHFRYSFGVGILLVAGGLLVATTSLDPTSGTIKQPKVVEISVEQAGATDLLHSTGCEKPAESKYVVVAGRWDLPVLEVDGPGCEFGATWRPSPDLIELRLPPGT